MSKKNTKSGRRWTPHKGLGPDLPVLHEDFEGHGYTAGVTDVPVRLEWCGICMGAGCSGCGNTGTAGVGRFTEDLPPEALGGIGPGW